MQKFENLHARVSDVTVACRLYGRRWAKKLKSLNCVHFASALVSVTPQIGVYHRASLKTWHSLYDMVSRFGLAVRLVKRKDLGSIPLRFSFLFKKVVVCGHCLVTLSFTSY